ncbi:MAG: pyruvate carboxylase subunit B [Dehalococcoidia bacterium]|nr:pyruvate carboxylase subunit B [Dehalococcoidia bacterium]
MQTHETRKNPVLITDLTLRDGHQSLFATRMRTEDMEPIAADIEKAGFWSVEMWGGATFDVTTRFLNEDPWERIRRLRKLMPKSRFQMLLRGQNLVGYRHYADDVVKAFVHHAAETGIDVFRVFDAVNDERNFETAFKAIKESGKHIQGTLCYSLTQQKLGGPIYNVDYFVNKALVIQDMGADSFCIKDMAGLIAPDDAYELVKALKKALKIPVALHSHYTSGMATMSLLKAIEAGVDMIDTAIAPFALRSSHPALEPLLVALKGTPREANIDLKLLLKIGEYLESIVPKYRDFMDTTKLSVIDSGVLLHQIPGGMFTNLVSQLREAGALDKLNEVYAELPRTRKELGYPPLVTPTSQIVGAQAVSNVLFGRYKMVSREVKDYVYGLYGRSPAPVDPEVQKIVLKGYERGETPITKRAADILPAEMEKAKDATKGISRDVGDVLVYALYPVTGMRFLKWKYGLEVPPPETKAKTLDAVKREDELCAKAKAGKLTEKPAVVAPARGSASRAFNVFIGEEYYKVEVEPVSGSPTSALAPAVAPAPPASVAKAAPAAPAATPAAAPKQAQQEAPKAAAAPVVEPGEGTITSPMPGILVRFLAQVGQQVEPGTPIAAIEAMKMENTISAETKGKVKSLHGTVGGKVSRGEIIAVIA